MSKVVAEFMQCFVESNRWTYLLSGLRITLTVTLFSLILGVVLGALIAMIRVTHDKAHKPGPIMKLFNFLCNVYLTIIRGTPSMLQLLIMYFVIFGSVKIDKIVVACLAFGINSGAYVAEIIRSGIMSIDPGQMEAGRSLGLSYWETMWDIILPQAFKNVLPALGNEMIVLLKETSISGYIALQDLTKGADIIRSQTYIAFMPLLGAAAIYLCLVMILTKLVSIMERRLAASDR